MFVISNTGYTARKEKCINIIYYFILYINVGIKRLVVKTGGLIVYAYGMV